MGLSGISVVNFLKKEIKNFKVWDDKQNNLYKNYRTKNLNKSLNLADYIVLSVLVC